MLYRVNLALAGFEPTTLVDMGTYCIGTYKSNYHMITSMTVPIPRVGYAPLIISGEYIEV